MFWNITCVYASMVTTYVCRGQIAQTAWCDNIRGLLGRGGASNRHMLCCFPAPPHQLEHCCLWCHGLHCSKHQSSLRWLPALLLLLLLVFLLLWLPTTVPIFVGASDASDAWWATSCPGSPCSLGVHTGPRRSRPARFSMIKLVSARSPRV